VDGGAPCDSARSGCQQHRAHARDPSDRSPRVRRRAAALGEDDPGVSSPHPQTREEPTDQAVDAPQSFWPHGTEDPERRSLTRSVNRPACHSSCSHSRMGGRRPIRRWRRPKVVIGFAGTPGWQGVGSRDVNAEPRSRAWSPWARAIAAASGRRRVVPGAPGAPTTAIERCRRPALRSGISGGIPVRLLRHLPTRSARALDRS